MSFLLVLLCSYSSSPLKVFVLSVPSDHKNLAEVQWPRWSGRSLVYPVIIGNAHSYGPLPVISIYNPIYRMYNPIFNQL